MKEIDASQIIAWFSTEIGLKSNVLTYSDGLGMPAGDTIRSSADMGVTLAAVTMLHGKGYFTQRIDVTGWQHQESVNVGRRNFQTREGS